METFVSIGLGVFVPAVVSYVKSVAWNTHYKVAAALVVSYVAAAVALFAQGSLSSISDLGVHGAVVWVSATAFYKLHFGNTELNAKLETMGVGAGD